MMPSPAGAPRPAHDVLRPQDARAAAHRPLEAAPDLSPTPPASSHPDPALLERCLDELLAGLPAPVTLDPETEAGWAEACAEQLAGLAPRNALEGMMAVQMVALHRSGLRSLKAALLPEAMPAHLAATGEGWPPRPIAPGTAEAARDRGLQRAGQAFALFGRLAGQLARNRQGPHRQVTIVHLRRGPSRRALAAAEREVEAEAERAEQRRELAEITQSIVRRIDADVAACGRADGEPWPDTTAPDATGSEAAGSEATGRNLPEAPGPAAEVPPWEDPNRTPEERAIAGLFARHFPHARHHAAAVAAGIGDDGVPVLGAEADALVAALGARFKQRPPDGDGPDGDGSDGDGPGGDGPRGERPGSDAPDADSLDSAGDDGP